MTRQGSQMFDPTLQTQNSNRAYGPIHNRRGAVLPLFAFLLPVLLILSGFAINLAYMQLVSTEMKIATDATSHAAGRAMSETQRTAKGTAQQRRTKIVDEIQKTITRVSKYNLVAGQELQIPLDDSHVLFGTSRRKNGTGMYEFEQIPLSKIQSGAERASSMGIIGQINVPLAFNAMKGMTSFNPQRRSVATQVDRDIALVLDRSGSMLYFKDEVALSSMMRTLYDTTKTVRKRRWNRRKRRYEYYNQTERLISYSDYRNATRGLYDRTYSSDVVDEMWAYANDTGKLAHDEIYEYVNDWRRYTTSWSNGFKTKAPRHSRWSFLVQGVDAFLNVLDETDQIELVSLVTFNSNARLDYALMSNYQPIRDFIADEVPLGGTGIGRGLRTGLPPIVNGASARPFAAKTIVVLTDGENTSGEKPEDAVKAVVKDNSVTIHAVTFTKGAKKEPMQKVAKAGNGQAFHADDGERLVEIFEEIANNLPTILTE